MAYPNDGPPLYQQILDTVKARLESIAPPDYFTRVDGVTFLEMGQKHTSVNDPHVFIYELNHTRESRQVAFKVTRNLLLRLVLQFRYQSHGTDWKTRLIQFQEDVMHAFEGDTTDLQLGGLANWVEVRSSATYDAQATPGLAEAAVDLDIQYRHQLGNPSLI